VGNVSGREREEKKGVSLMKEMLENQEMKEFIKTFETGRYVRTVVYKTKSCLRCFQAFIEAKGMNPDKWEDITTGVLDDYRKSLEESGKKESTVLERVFKARQFLSFIEKSRGLTIPGLHENKTEGVESMPAEFQKVYFDYSKAVTQRGVPERSIQRIKFMVRTFYRYLMERHVQRFIEIRRTDVKDFTRYLMDLTDAKGDRLYCASSVNIFLTIIRGFLFFLSKQGVCTGLADLIHSVKREVYLSKNILSRKELIKLFGVKAESLEEFMMKTIIVLLYGSGIRIGEVVALKFKDINEARLTEKKEVCIFETKTNKERTVQLGEVAAEYLRLYIEAARPYIRDLIYRNTDKEARLSDYIFASLSYAERSAPHINPHTVNKYLKLFCKRAGIKKLITCHCFRHSYGTHLLENGAGIKEVSELLGHEDLTTTERYTRLNPEHLRQTLLKYHPRESLDFAREPEPKEVEK
jgi:site-specific recombinase XerD